MQTIPDSTLITNDFLIPSIIGITQNFTYTCWSCLYVLTVNAFQRKLSSILKVYENMDLYLHSSPLELEFLRKRDSSTDNLQIYYEPHL
jgi:hypothetical protein